MKTTSTRKTTRLKRPYEKSITATRARSSKTQSPARVSETASALSQSLPPTATATSSSALAKSSAAHSTGQTGLARDVYVEFFNKTYPGMEPRHDYDLSILGSNRREGTPTEIFAWADEQLRVSIKLLGSREKVFANTKKALDMVVGITGRKPRPGRDLVHTRPIPGSKYSIRLWPGNPYVHEYCMDFVDTETEEAVNSPFDFELWVVPSADAPWLSMPSGRLHSLERNFHIAQDKILQGEEKWVLRDGQTCLLKRPGKKNVMFTVPKRKLNPSPAADCEVDILDFPKEV